MVNLNSYVPSPASGPTNSDRAEWAEQAVTAFMNTTGTDKEDALADLLCDLMQWADHTESNFKFELSRARSHYDAEVEEEHYSRR